VCRDERETFRRRDDKLVSSVRVSAPKVIIVHEKMRCRADELVQGRLVEVGGWLERTEELFNGGDMAVPFLGLLRSRDLHLGLICF
jgi:hypothetical protein